MTEESLASQPSDSTIIEILRNLKPGSRIEVWWADASERDFGLEVVELPILNSFVETRVREIGWFLGLQKGEFWGDLHLLFESRVTDADTVGARHRITSIPLARKCAYCGEYTLTLVHELVALEEKVK